MRRPLAVLTALAVTVTILLVATPADAASRYRVTAHASAGNLDVGQSFTLKGKVRPNAPGQKVKIQRWTGSHWAKVAKTRLNKHSSYKTTIKLTAPGDNRYRVVKPTSSGHKKGVSPAVTVVGWRWRSVTSLPLGYETPSGAQIVPSVTLDALTFTPAVVLGDPSGSQGYIGYQLDGKCTQFDSHIGVTADSATSTPRTYEFWVYKVATPTSGYIEATDDVVRGKPPAHLYRGPGLMSQVDTIVLGSDAVPAGDYIAWGDPRVYCRS